MRQNLWHCKYVCRSPNSVSTLRGSYGSCKGGCLIRVLTLGPGIFPVNFLIKCFLWYVDGHFDCAGSHKVWAMVLGNAVFPVSFRIMWRRLANSVVLASGPWLHLHHHHPPPPHHHHHNPFWIFMLMRILLNIIILILILLIINLHIILLHLIILNIIILNIIVHNLIIIIIIIILLPLFLLLIIIITTTIIIIILNIILHYPSTPPTLFGVSCRHNCFFGLRWTSISRYKAPDIWIQKRVPWFFSHSHLGFQNHEQSHRCCFCCLASAVPNRCYLGGRRWTFRIGGAIPVLLVN